MFTDRMPRTHTNATKYVSSLSEVIRKFKVQWIVQMQDVSHVFDLYLAAADYRAPPEFNNLTAEAVPESGGSALQPHVKPLASACVDVWWCKIGSELSPQVQHASAS